jgi:hypothetical protein
MKNISKRFLAECKNTWDPHPFNIRAEDVNVVQQNYNVIADSARGPQVAEHFNCIATQFNLCMKYKESI